MPAPRSGDRQRCGVSVPAAVNGTNRPRGWNRWSPAEKVEHLLGMWLDRMAEILSWPADGLDPYRLAVQAQVIRVVAMMAPEAGGGSIPRRSGRRGRRSGRAGSDDVDRGAGSADKA
jgi:hypothetical protein